VRKYFFHTIHLVRDRQGVFLPNDAEAKRHAENLSALLEVDATRGDRKWKVQVTDETGRLVCEVHCGAD
jgi:hypothetical protein